MSDPESNYQRGLTLLEQREAAPEEAGRYFFLAAEEGHAPAMLALAGCYKAAVGGVAHPDLDKYVQYLKRSAAEGYPKAMHQLGMAYFKGTGLSMDYAKAARWFGAAAAAGLDVSMNVLGQCYERGDGVDRNLATALEWYQAAVAAGLSKASKGVARVLSTSDSSKTPADLYHLGVSLENGSAGDQGLKLIEAAACRGHPGAEFHLGQSYHTGMNGRVDLAEAVGWYTKAAAQGHAQAGYALALLYESGKPGVVEESVEQALRYLEVARAGGLDVSEKIVRLTALLPSPADEEEPVLKLLGKSGGARAEKLRAEAKKGKTPAMVALGKMYLAGDGVRESATNAMRWLQKAARANNTESMALLAWNMLHGVGHDVDVEQAKKWASLADRGRPPFPGTAKVLRELRFFKKDKDGCYYDSRTETADGKSLLGKTPFEDSAPKAAAVARRVEQQGVSPSLQPPPKKSAAKPVQHPPKKSVAQPPSVQPAKKEPTALDKLKEEVKNLSEEELCKYAEGFILKDAAADKEKGFRLFRLAAKLGPLGMGYVGNCYYKGVGVARDLASAVKAFTMAANAGNASAMNMLARCHAKGHGTPQSTEEAARWLKAAADAGHVTSQFAIGGYFETGQMGLPRDEDMAVTYFVKAMRAGHPGATAKIKSYYPVDSSTPERAPVDVTPAALGDAAEHELAGLAPSGQFARALEYFKAGQHASAARGLYLAARGGLADAQYALASAYMRGEGVPQSFEESAKLLRAAASQGHVTAAYRLGVCYFSGLGVDTDFGEARVWFTAALAKGHAQARVKLEELKWVMVSEDDDPVVVHVEEPAVRAVRLYESAVACEFGEDKDLGQSVALLREAAALGSATAHRALGWHLQTGLPGVLAADQAQAAEHYRAAADQGDPAACFLLALCLEEGRGVAQDLDAALELLASSAEHGHAKACKRLGLPPRAPSDELRAAVDAYRASMHGHSAKAVYAEGLGLYQATPPKYEEAVERFRRAADLGFAPAQHNLAVCLHRGLGCAEDVAAATALYRSSAEAGNAVSMFILSSLVGDESEASAWLERAAAQGYPAAQAAVRETRPARPVAELDAMVARGVDLEKQGEVAAAVPLYTRAAAAGHRVAQFRLGHCYRAGAGVDQDMARAVKLFRAAAEQGWPQAQFNLSSCYFRGLEVEQDPVQGVAWLRRAADQGHAGAQARLADCYEHGVHVGYDLAKALALYTAAAGTRPDVAVHADRVRALLADFSQQALDAADVQYEVSVRFKLGLGGVVRDPAQERVWLTKAADQGHAGALTDLAARTEDPQSARDMLERAAETGYPDAMARLAAALEASDPARALHWYEKCDLAVPALKAKVLALRQALFKDESDEWFARGTDAFAQGDLVECIRCYTCAADLGHDGAGFRLGVAFLTGRGVDRDEREGLERLSALAKAGHSHAAARLASFYEAAEDFTTALSYLRRLAELKDARGYAGLARFYEQGLAVPKDPAKARAWLAKTQP